MKGHQIIGELRPPASSMDFSIVIEGSPDHWWVTTQGKHSDVQLLRLKGHQIIGELRLHWSWLHTSFQYWRVTRSLVSYDITHSWGCCCCIEGSPDHWWVTTIAICFKLDADDWRVTRSLVSYDESIWASNFLPSLKGHQIIGELRLSFQHQLKKTRVIEGSPDHWWVTTLSLSCFDSHFKLKGHQIIGELRLWRPAFNDSDIIEGSPDHWWVTTCCCISNSIYHLIEGSPDHWWVTTCHHQCSWRQLKLKGHQIIGELRLEQLPPPMHVTLKGHQIIGELRHLGTTPPNTFINWRVTRSLVSYDFYVEITVEP